MPFGRVAEVLALYEEELLPSYSEEDVQLFYGDWRRGYELLRDITQLLLVNSVILDAGSAPGFTSLALKLLGYDVYSLNINPEPYKALLEEQRVKVIKADLENEIIPLSQESVDCVVFTEVLEHLHPYKMSFTLSEINRVLRRYGILYLTTPNAVSIGKRIKMLFGLQPIGEKHVREYTVQEVITLLTGYGFKILQKGFSMAYNLTPHDARGEDYKSNLLRAMFSYSTKGNLFHIITLPIVFTIPSLRATVKIVARKERYVKPHTLNRRF
jgi:SAM-dependent methyltransferase